MKSNFFLTKPLLGITLVILMLNGCGGGSSEGGALVYGTLVQTGDGGHEEKGLSLVLKHFDGEALESVKVCLYGECSVTDGLGNWGVNLPSLPAGDVLISIEGHGILDSVTATIPNNANDVTINLANTADGVVVEELTVNG